MPDTPQIQWTENESERHMLWRSVAGLPPPRRVTVVDDSLTAAQALRLASQGHGLLWRGDYHNARQLLQALARRIERGPRQQARPAPAPSLAEAFHLQRKAQAERSRLLGLLLLPFEAGHRIPLRRAPDVCPACEAVWGPADGPYVASLRDLLGLIGAHEWRRRGVAVPALGARIHPHHGVFAPVRGEYVDLVAHASWPGGQVLSLAFDIGTGTGVLAAVLLRRGVARVVATDHAAQALACADDNLQRLGLRARAELVQADLYPPGRADLIVCNPPWLPARAATPLEQAVYDPDSRMLRGFLQGLAAHLAPGGEGWLILSDLAEHLGLRSRAQLLQWFAEAGVAAAGCEEIAPRHPRAVDRQDPLHAARSAERTMLWRLRAA